MQLGKILKVMVHSTPHTHVTSIKKILIVTICLKGMFVSTYFC